MARVVLVSGAVTRLVTVDRADPEIEWGGDRWRQSVPHDGFPPGQEPMPSTLGMLPTYVPSGPAASVA